MRMTLKNGLNLKIAVIYQKEFLPEMGRELPEQNRWFQTTKIVLMDTNLQILASGTSYCSPLDQFSPVLGRKLALKKLFITHTWSKEDRRQIYKKLLAKFHKEN